MLPMIFQTSNTSGFTLINDGKLPRFGLVGYSKDSTGAIIPSCTMEAYEAISGLFRGSTISDANGYYVIPIDGPASGLTFFVAGKDSTGLYTGSTVDTLIGIEL